MFIKTTNGYIFLKNISNTQDFSWTQNFSWLKDLH